VHIISPRFTVGWMVITPRALVALVEAQEDPKSFIYRHIKGDWGDLGPEGWAENEYALRHGERLFSIYQTRHGRRLFVLTEANRYATTILLPEDYATLKERSL
jgi:hypothetical protein